MHILVISQHFYPENFRINQICIEWIKRGYRVTVLTGIPNYPKGKFYNGYGYRKKRKEKWQNIDIIRIPIISRGKTKFQLGLNYLSFVISGFFWSLKAKIDADLIYIYETSPILQALPGLWYGKKRKIPTIIYITDLWPESFEFGSGIKNKYIISLMQKITDNIYNKSSKILIASKGFLKPIKKRMISESKIEYWPQFPEDFYKKKNITEIKDFKIPQDEILNITFAGNIGEAQGLTILIDVARYLESKNKLVRFNIIGDGRFKDKLINLVVESKLDIYFNFIESVKPFDIPDYLSQSDLAFISLKDVKLFDFTLPSKLQTYLACGTPILASAKGELRRIILESKAGLCSFAGDHIGLAKNIIIYDEYSIRKRNEFSNNALNYCKKNFDKDELLDRLDTMFLNEKKRRI